MKELDVVYGEERLGFRFACSGCFLNGSGHCWGLYELADEEGYGICIGASKRNITNKDLILTKERTKNSLCKIRRIAGKLSMELLEQEEKCL